MFIIVTVVKIKSKKEILENGDGTEYNAQEVRIKSLNIRKYYDAGSSKSVLDMEDDSRWYVTETVQELDAMLGTPDAKAVKVLFGAK